MVIGCLHIYALVTDNPYGERLLGECYAEKSADYAAKANIYFKQDLKGYKAKLTKPPIKDKAQIELLIGSQYEFGKGVAINLTKAKYWYKKANRDCAPKDENTINLLNAALNRIRVIEKKL